MKRKIALEIISVLLIFLFVYAAFSKLLDVEKFRIQIGQSPILANLTWLVAWLIPLLEVAISIFLAIPKLRSFGLLAAFGLMVLFTAYIISILQFSEHIPCSCGGVLQALTWTEHLIFNIAFTTLALAGIILTLKEAEAKSGVGYQ